MPGMSASVSSSILVMENPSPTFSKVTFAPVWTRAGVRPARESCAVSAIVKHPAWAAPISSSGLVAAWPSSNRDLNEYGPSKAPLPTLSRPLPSTRLPFHSASAFRVGMEPPFALPSFWVSLFDALLDLLGPVPAINRDYLSASFEPSATLVPSRKGRWAEGYGGMRADPWAPVPISRQNAAARGNRRLPAPGSRRQEPLNRSFLIPSVLIFDSNVEPGMPSFAAAPDGPDTRPLLPASAAPIIRLSPSTSSSPSGRTA